MNHYDWLEQNLNKLYGLLNIKYSGNGVIVADGDKCYGYEDKWRKHGVPFEHGVALYIMSKDKPFCNEVRQTANGWIDVSDWVIKKYSEVKHVFDSLTQNERR